MNGFHRVGDAPDFVRGAVFVLYKQGMSHVDIGASERVSHTTFGCVVHGVQSSQHSRTPDLFRHVPADGAKMSRIVKKDHEEDQFATSDAISCRLFEEDDIGVARATVRRDQLVKKGHHWHGMEQFSPAVRGTPTSVSRCG